MFYQLGNVNIDQFRGFQLYCTYNLQNREKIEFFDLKYRFFAFSDTFNFGLSVEISARVEISTMKIMWKKTYDVDVNPP